MSADDLTYLGTTNIFSNISKKGMSVKTKTNNNFLLIFCFPTNMIIKAIIKLPK